MGLTKEQKTEYQREYMRKLRSNKVVGLTEETPQGLTSPVGLTESPLKEGGSKVRLNPRTGRAYGPSMLGLLGYPKGAECLKEYEKRYNQTEAVYGLVTSTTS